MRDLSKLFELVRKRAFDQKADNRHLINGIQNPAIAPYPCQTNVATIRNHETSIGTLWLTLMALPEDAEFELGSGHESVVFHDCAVRVRNSENRDNRPVENIAFQNFYYFCFGMDSDGFGQIGKKVVQK